MMTTEHPIPTLADVQRAYRIVHHLGDDGEVTNAEVSFLSRVLALQLRAMGSSGGEALDSPDPFEGHRVDGGGVEGIDWA